VLDVHAFEHFGNYDGVERFAEFVQAEFIVFLQHQPQVGLEQVVIDAGACHRTAPVIN